MLWCIIILLKYYIKRTGLFMGIERIYYELKKNEEDEYDINLAQNDVLFIPVIIDIMLDKSNSSSIWAENLLEKISKINPLTVYPYMQYIAKSLDKTNAFNGWNVWKIITNLLYCDYMNYWDDLREKYYISLNSTHIAEFSICCECACNIISAKPDEKEHITEILKNTVDRIFYIGEEISVQSHNVAMEKANEVLQNIAKL